MLRQLTGFIFPALAISLITPLTCSGQGGENLTEKVQKALDKSKSVDISVPDFQSGRYANIRKAAEQAAQHIKGKEGQKQIEEMQAQLSRLWAAQQEEGSDNTCSVRTEVRSVNQEQQDADAEAQRIYLFISSSMPMQTIQNYLHDVSARGSIEVVMRGMVGGLGNKVASLAFFSEALKEDPLCQDGHTACKRLKFKKGILVKPSLFDKYRVSSVPTVVLDTGEDAYRIEGDGSLEAAISRLEKEAQKKRKKQGD